MEKNGSTSSPRRRSVGVTILALVEIVLGVLGALLFFNCVLLFLREFGRSSACFLSIDLSILYGAMTLPFVFILTSGIGMLALKDWARKMNIFVVPLAFLLTAAFLSFGAIGEISKGNLCGGLSTILVMFIPLCIIFFLKIKFLTCPKVKKQFK